MSQQETRFEIDASTQTPWVAETLAQHDHELRPQVERCGAELRALPRRARRALQRRLARSRDLTTILEEWLQGRAGRTLQRRLARSLAGAALLLALVQGVGQAATITVTTNVPGINPDGKCSLIEAILNANAGAQPQADCGPGDPAPTTNTIVLPAATHTLSTRYGGGENGLPLIKSAITIEGNGAKITRKASAPPFRLLEVDPSGNLTLQNVTLSGGDATYTVQRAGGAIENAGVVTIQNSTITGNQARSGGGIDNVSTGTLTVENSAISTNKAAPIYGFGAAIYNYGGTVVIHDSIITGNQAGATAGMGVGGGILNIAGTVTLENSTISGNKANGPNYGLGGGLANFSTGSLATFTVINSTVSKNIAGAAGGGVLNDGSMTIQNSTISGNKAGKTYGYGGGIENVNGASLTIENSTISNNKANGKIAYGGGIENTGDLTLSRSLISGNKAKLGREVDNCIPCGSVTASDYNLFGFKGNPGTVGFLPSGSDIVPSVGVASILGPLKNNGGPTFTHALKPGSPAVNAVPSSDPACTGTDQRGVTRPQPAGGNCDIGSFELQ